MLFKEEAEAKFIDTAYFIYMTIVFGYNFEEATYGAGGRNACEVTYPFNRGPGHRRVT